jgi:hypothetical protein
MLVELSIDPLGQKHDSQPDGRGRLVHINVKAQPSNWLPSPFDVARRER